MLCDVCQGIEYGDLIQETAPFLHIGFQHHKSFTELEACPRCDFCTAVCESVSNNSNLTTGDLGWREDPLFVRAFPSSTGDGDERDYSNLLVFSSSGEGSKRKEKTLAFFGIYIEKTRDELETGRIDTIRPESSLITARNISKASNDDDCFATARSWLKQCTASEPHGLKEFSENQVEVEHFRPSRTIDVGLPEGTIVPRLVCHKDQPVSDEPFEWVTLSHSWGGSSPISTTLSTLAKHQKSIPIFSMPRTFQDAILATRKLGFRHLWIDSLCIVQDSSEDWKAEAAQMGKIYQKGVLNIAADQSPNCDGGLFHVRSSEKRDIILPLRSQKLGLETIMYARPGLWDRYEPYILGSESTLTSRGWVLQEAVLSPRTVHYAQQQMFWECEHVTLAEGNIDPRVNKGKSGLLIGHHWVSHKMVLPHNLRERAKNQVFDKDDIIHRSWLLLVKRYTARHLTVQSDVFASLAGLASIFQQALNERYLAGIFEGDLIKGLLWRIVDSKTAIKRDVKGIPSWSWASIIGAAEFENAMDSNMSVPQSVGELGARIVEVNSHYGDATGLISHDYLTDFAGGEIVIDGLILENTDRFSYLRDDFKSLGSSAKFETSRRQTWYFDRKVIEETATAKDLALLYLGAWEWWVQGGASWKPRFYRRFSGLLLKPVGGKEGTYERVGVMSLTFWFLNVEEPCGFESEDEKFLQGWGKRKLVRII